jgi:hypothetical protein
MENVSMIAVSTKRLESLRSCEILSRSFYHRRFYLTDTGTTCRDSIRNTGTSPNNTNYYTRLRFSQVDGIYGACSCEILSRSFYHRRFYLSDTGTTCRDGVRNTGTSPNNTNYYTRLRFSQVDGIYGDKQDEIESRPNFLTISRLSDTSTTCRDGVRNTGTSPNNTNYYTRLCFSQVDGIYGDKQDEIESRPNFKHYYKPFKLYQS